MNINYPIKFQPILKEKIWGGKKLINVLNKKSNSDNVGESWEISGVEESISIVSNGALKGKSLNEIISIFKANILGETVFNNFGESFPLLIKFIDAKRDLSVQVHPNDRLAAERHNSFGKTEMWYVMQADEGAKLIAGFNDTYSEAEYLKHVEENTLLKMLNIDKVSVGDTYFVPAGSIHAIGGGILLAEIQQTSDITYRLYDWDRVDSEGNSRDLHVAEAKDAVDYSNRSCKKEFKKEQNSTTEIVSCPYFTTSVIPIKGEVSVDYSDKDSFVVYICVKGEVTIFYADNNQLETIIAGQTVLIPAVLKSIKLVSSIDSELLEVYIK